MMPLHPSFRRLLQENIPQLTDEKLNRYESLLALRGQLLQQLSLVEGPPIEDNESPEPDQPDSGKPHYPKRPKGKPAAKQTQQESPREQLEGLIERTTQEANNIIAPFRREFDALHRLWMARRRLAIEQGGLLQIPTTKEGWAGLFGALTNYYPIQVKTFLILLPTRIKNISAGKAIVLAVALVLIYFGLNALSKGKDVEKIPRPPEHGKVYPDTTKRQLPDTTKQ